MKKTYLYSIFSLFLLLFSACITDKMPFRPEEIKRRVLDSFPLLLDTAFVGLINVSENANKHWTLAYNKEQMSPFIYIYDAEDRLVPAQKMLIKRPDCIIEKIQLNDVNQDGLLEMLVYVYYNYGISYKGREVIIYANAFDSIANKRKEIFAHPLEQIWKKIDSFDMEYGLPQHTEKVGVEMSVEFFEQMIQLRGTYEGIKNVLREYKWSEEKLIFELLKHDELHEIVATEVHDSTSIQLGKNRLLLEVVAHEVGCRSFVLQDNKGIILALPTLITDALYCSPVTSISPDGEYLIFTNKANKTLDLYEFSTRKRYTLVDRIGAIEGISDIVWTSFNKEIYAACILVNPEEYLYNTRVAIFKIQPKNTPIIELHDKSAWYVCNARTGFCTSRIDEDYYFNKQGSFSFRLRDLDKRLDSFSMIPLKK